MKIKYKTYKVMKKVLRCTLLVLALTIVLAIGIFMTKAILEADIPLWLKILLLR